MTFWYELWVNQHLGEGLVFASTRGKRGLDPDQQTENEDIFTSTLHTFLSHLLLTGDVHTGVRCGSCRGPVRGSRYKCLQCRDFDLCATCEASGTKHSHHSFIRLPSRISVVPLTLDLDGITSVMCDECKRNVVGRRYKCLHCRNYDLCLRCEAASKHRNHRMLRIPFRPQVQEEVTLHIPNFQQFFRIGWYIIQGFVGSRFFHLDPGVILEVEGDPLDDGTSGPGLPRQLPPPLPLRPGIGVAGSAAGRNGGRAPVALNAQVNEEVTRHLTNFQQIFRIGWYIIQGFVGSRFFHLDPGVALEVEGDPLDDGTSGPGLPHQLPPPPPPRAGIGVAGSAAGRNGGRAPRALNGRNSEVHEEVVPRDEDLCKLCLEAELNCAFVDCGHMVACLPCAQMVRNCPICRKAITRRIRIFKA
ncbi:unnamed protein product [Darwinula stevensoni]|uniref:Uncharacterized protein n=1 Tax=Darwinula stevensoni TaxID=69355 RepID=A0A7R9AB45_9CRUS|nr:unnamed protein product [Darwinula stevensoni]CAG0899057.1 unnamed protein product [Darwinula stevensoni]